MPEDEFTASGENRDEPEGAADPGSPFLERVMRYLDDALGPAEVAELERELASSASKREAFALICFGDSLARETLAQGGLAGEGLSGDPFGDPLGIGTIGEVGEWGSGGLGAEGKEAGEGGWEPGLSDAMVLPAIRPEPEPEPEELPGPAPTWPAPEAPDRGRTWRRRGGLAAAVALLAGGGLFLALHGKDKADKGFGPAVARVDSVVGAQWEGPGGAREDLGPGAEIHSGVDLTLTAGCADLRFQDGADVVLEGPAHLKIESGSALTLISGKVVVRMSNGGSGFAVRTASGIVTDLGTEFAVAVDPSPNGPTGADVEVFQGRVQIAPAPARAGAATGAAPSVVAAGDAARLAGGAVTVAGGAARPQSFVRTLAAVPSLDVVDLLCGGDGTTHLRGNQIDATSGAAGNLAPAGNVQGDDRYHPVPSLPVVDGCFVPNGANGPVRTDSAGHTFAFPKTTGGTYLHITAGGQIPVPAGLDPIGTALDGVDYAGPDHGLLLVHPNAALTLDLSAVRRLYPGSRLVRFHCALGNSHPTVKQTKADAYVLADGVARFERRQFTGADGASWVDVPIQDSDRFLTLASTDGGDGTASDDVLLGDPTFDLAPAQTPAQAPAQSPAQSGTR